MKTSFKNKIVIKLFWLELISHTTILRILYDWSIFYVFLLLFIVYFLNISVSKLKM